MQTDIDPRDLIGHKVVDRNGDKIGTVDEVYLDDATGVPEWAAVRTGVFGRDTLVPLATSEFKADELRLPYDKSLIKESPDFGAGQHLSPAQELQLYHYYGLERPAPTEPPAMSNGANQAADRDLGRVTTVTPAAAPAVGEPMLFASPSAQGGLASPANGSVRNGLDAANVRRIAVGDAAGGAPPGPIEITRREERLEITTEWYELGTARMHTYVTSENVEHRVPVVRERVRVERLPVSETERAALTDQEIAESVEEVTLREERPVVHKYVAPIERIRLVVERYTEEEIIREELRRENVEVHDGMGAAAPQPPAQPPVHTSGGGRPEPLRPY